MKRSYRLYGLIHEAALEAGAKSHEPLTPDQELVEFVESGRIAAGARVLDLGCGAGRNAVWLAQQGFEVTALDVSRHALQLAGAWAAENRVVLHLMQVDATGPSSLPENMFGLAYDGRCLHLIIEQELRDAYLRSVLKTLQPGGIYFAINCGGRDEEEALRVVASDGKPRPWVFEGSTRIERLIPDTPCAPMWPEKHRQELERAGFEVDEVSYCQTDRPPTWHRIQTVARKPSTTGGSSSAHSRG